MDVIETRDNRTHIIDNDTDFESLLEDYMGYSAAQWFRERLMRVDDLVQEAKGLLPAENELMHKTDSGLVIYDRDKISKIGLGTLVDITEIVMEIPGWDE